MRSPTARSAGSSENATYHRLIAKLTRFVVPPGQRVLEIGCGSGSLLAALEPSVGVGVDVSARMVELAQARHPELRFVQCAGEELDLGEQFDFIVISDLLPFVHDLVALFRRIGAHSHPRTRVVINSYNSLWKPVIGLAERLRLKPRKPIRNWVNPEDVRNVLQLAGFEVVTLRRRILFPKRVPVLDVLLNGFLASLWPFNHACLTYWIVARPQSTPLGTPSVSVVCPCRNEAGNIVELIDRLPVVGSATELIFVEGGSTDETRATIVANLDRRDDIEISLLDQTGTGKGDAVRAGFAAAHNDVLMILDGDLSVRPEDLPKFYAAISEGRGELVNGSRLVYDLEPGAMQFLNVLGNKTFSLLFRAITGQHVKDTLCGTKVLHRDDYAEIAEARSYFGDFDPFGDFDLLFGGTRAQPEDRRHARPVPEPHVRPDEHQPLAPRAAAVPDDALRLLEVQGRTVPVGRIAPWVAFCAALAVSAVIVAAQPLGSPWWTYADADSTYAASSLNLLEGVQIRFLDHPGLPLEELGTVVFGARHAVSRATGSKQTTLQYVDSLMLDLNRAKTTWRTLALLIYLAGTALAFVLAARLFGHWSYGLAAGLLWVAAPGLAAMSIQIRPDVSLSIGLLVATFLLGRAAQGRAAGAFGWAAFTIGFTTMVKLPAAGLLVSLAILAVARTPGEGWAEAAWQGTRAFARRRRWLLGAVALLWLALAADLNRHWWRSYRPDRERVLVAVVPVLVVGGFALACWAVRRATENRVARRIFNPFFAFLGAALLAGLAVPITLDVPDGLTALIRITDGLTGGGVNGGIPLFATSLHQLLEPPLREALVFFVLAGVAAVYGLLRHDVLPAAWFAGAATLGVMAQARLATVHYFAPAYVVSVFGALWLFHALGRRRMMPVLAWAFVLFAVVPQIRDRGAPARDAARFARNEAASLRFIAQRLQPGEVGVTPSSWPNASSRYSYVVQPYVNYSPPYPYTFVDATQSSAALAAERHLRLRYYTGPDVLQLPSATGTMQIGTIGRFQVRKLRPDVVELVSGPGA